MQNVWKLITKESRHPNVLREQLYMRFLKCWKAIYPDLTRKNCGRKPKLKAGAAHDYVLEKMALRWSPEQIAG